MLTHRSSLLAAARLAGAQLAQTLLARLRPICCAGVTAVAAVALLAAVATPAAWAGVDPAALPEAKRSKPALYLEARDVPEFIARTGSPKVLLLDVRTRTEAMYVGMADGVDALVPYVEHQELMTDWDEQRRSYRLEPNQDFVPEVGRRLAAKGLTKADTVVLICRSGDRSGRAASRLAEDGYARVYSVIDGFEGDMSKEGRRNVNGWKNAGLPWSYKLDKARMYFPR
jgi:rhodanese-related sulfurtransferase